MKDNEVAFEGFARIVDCADKVIVRVASRFVPSHFGICQVGSLFEPRRMISNSVVFENFQISTVFRESFLP